MDRGLDAHTKTIEQYILVISDMRVVRASERGMYFGGERRRMQVVCGGDDDRKPLRHTAGDVDSTSLP